LGFYFWFLDFNFLYCFNFVIFCLGLLLFILSIWNFFFGCYNRFFFFFLLFLQVNLWFWCLSLCWRCFNLFWWSWLCNLNFVNLIFTCQFDFFFINFFGLLTQQLFISSSILLDILWVLKDSSIVISIILNWLLTKSIWVKINQVIILLAIFWGQFVITCLL